jgi:hypothetical protein
MSEAVAEVAAQLEVCLRLMGKLAAAATANQLTFNALTYTGEGKCEGKQEGQKGRKGKDRLAAVYTLAAIVSVAGRP